MVHECHKECKCESCLKSINISINVNFVVRNFTQKWLEENRINLTWNVQTYLENIVRKTFPIQPKLSTEK